MFGKKRIWQKPPVSVEHPQPPFLSSPASAPLAPKQGSRTEDTGAGTPGQALQGSVQVAFNQQLQQEMADRKLGEDQCKIHLNRLEQRIKGQSVELIEIKDHLERLGKELTEKVAQITAANAQLQRQAAEQDHYLNQKLAVVTRMVQQLQHRVGDLDQKEIELLEDIIDAKQPGEETAGLNPQELKALSELAKRLAQ